MFRLGLAVGRALIRTGLKIARAPRRRALAAWAASEGLVLDWRTRARGTLANGAAVDAWLDEESNSAVIEMKTNVVLPSLAIRSRHAVVRSMEISLELGAVERTLSAKERTSRGGMFEARAERVAEDRLDDVFEVLERASSPPTAMFARTDAVVVEVYPVTSAAIWKAHAEMLEEIISRLSPKPRGPYG